MTGVWSIHHPSRDDSRPGVLALRIRDPGVLRINAEVPRCKDAGRGNGGRFKAGEVPLGLIDRRAKGFV